MKYVIVSLRQHKDMEVAIIFPEEVEHAAVRRAGKVLSGGFFHIDKSLGAVFVEGKSESLQVDSRQEDAEIIAKMLGLKAGMKHPDA